MSRVLLLLVGMFCASMNSWAQENQELLKNLSSRFHDLPRHRGTLIKSFTNHTQSYIYDQALAIIAFTKHGDLQRAKKLLTAMASLQRSDGSLYFSYYLDGNSPYPTEGDKRYAGAIAWVALAASHYQSKFKTNEFVSFNTRILNYLESQMHSIKVKDVKTRAVRFSPVDIPTTPWNENEVAALEHNLDAYVAFMHFASLNQNQWKQEAQDLKKFILTMWDNSRHHFWSGANFKDGAINKSEFYLDNQSWSLLALDHETLRQLRPEKALEENCHSLLVKHGGIEGFMDSKPVRRPASSQFVWSEGTLGQVIAMSRISKLSKKTIVCESNNAAYYLQNVFKMKKEDGGIAYSTPTSNPDFTTASSVAGTAWLYFASNDFNPFQLEEIN